MTCIGCKTSCAPYELKDGECHACTQRALVAARALLDAAEEETTALRRQLATANEALAAHRLPLPP